MDGTVLSQLQFAVTCIYHFFFVPLTLGLSVLVAILETFYVRTKNEQYKKLTKFFGNLFLINFAMGVVTGIVMEFQFGMNWSEYSRYVGDVFGAPLAVEALLAFFIESTFLGLWVFGWDKLSEKVHLLSIWLVAIASNLSALWILIANAFMQNPVGYAEEGGRLVMKDFGALITNPYVWGEFPHTVLAGFVTGAFFVMGISAYHMMKKKDVELFQRSFKIAAVFGLVAILGVIFFGDRQAKQLVNLQPMKLASMEALWESEDSAGLSIVAGIDEEAGENTFALRVPGALSFMVYGNFNGRVPGLNELQEDFVAKYGPGDYIPNVALNFWTFRIMVGLGMLMLLLALYAIFQSFRKGGFKKFPFLWVFPIAILFPYLSNTVGWMLTELGRQPWVVYGKLLTASAASPYLVKNPGNVLATLIIFTLVYGILMVVDLYLLFKFAKAGPDAKALTATAESPLE